MEHTFLSLPPLTTTGEVVTFYSYKGGTGRTMALSNIAVLLARQQHATTPVLMVDWDLEAPGLHHYFDDHDDHDDHDERPGVLELFEACREQLERRCGDVVSSDNTLDGDALALEVLATVGWEQYVRRVDQGSQLYLMRAGRFDDSYGERLAAMQWDGLFDRCPALFRCFAEHLARHFRHVLVDSRTGRTDTAGICTTLLPRKLVVVFTPNRQNLEGVRSLVTRATAYRRSHEDEQRPLLVYPLPSRIDMDDAAQRAQGRHGAVGQAIAGYQPIFEQLLSDCYGVQRLSLDSYFDEVQLQQSRTVAYGEQLAVQMAPDGDRYSLTRSFTAFLDWLGGGYFPWQSSREIQLLASIAEARKLLDDGGARALSQPMARDLNCLGELYRHEGKLRQAMDCFEESTVVRQRGLGEDHADTLVSKGNLAGILRQQGQLDEAQFLEECIIEARDRLLGPQHPDTLAARVSLAATLAQQGRTAEALAIQELVLETYMQLLGAEHLLTLSCKAGRADLLFQRGDNQHARSVQEQVLAVRKRLLGAEHADTLHSQSALARTLLKLQEPDAARKLYEAVLQAQIRRLGQDHPDTRQTRELLAAASLSSGGALAVTEIHQDAAADDYGDAMPKPLHLRGRSGAASLWPRSTDELLMLDAHLASARPPPS